MAENIDGLILNQVLSLLLKNFVVPTDFHSRVRSVKEMLEDDMSGLVDSLTDFAVTTASVDFTVETDNSELTIILKKWLDNINSPYNGQIPRGIKPLAEEYFKERWKSSSFPILKIPEWDTINGIKVPTKMFFVDGGSVYSEEIDKKKKETKQLIGYKYFLGKDKKDALDKGVIITKPYGRWFDEYPNPYLIKRGVYHNWKIIQSLKSRESEVLNQVIPYLFLVKKGNEALATQNIKTYSDPELKQTVKDFQDLINKMQSKYTSSLEKNTTPIRATNFDEEIKHLIVDLTNIFKPELFTVAEKSILSGLGFIDIAEAVSTSRRESILNPKAFIEETKKGVEDFKKILNELVARIIEENKAHKKYMNATFYIISSPIKGFMTDDFKNHLRLQWKNGQLSNQTYCELVGEVEYRTELARREREARSGEEITMYPHQTQNLEKDESFEEIKRQQKFYKEEKVADKKGKPLPPDKTEPEEKEEYDIGGLESPVKCSHCGHIFDFLAESEAGMGYVKCPKCDETVTQKDLIGNLTLEEAFKPEVTENYIRLRQRDPVDFQQKSFRIITLSKSKGIKAVIGRLKGKTTTTVQSYLFDKKKWSTKEAQAWVEKQKASDLETAPYTKISELPASIRKVLSPSLQRVFIRVFNSAYDKYHNESRAFRIAWGVIKKLAYKGKDGKWYRKTTKGKKVRLTKSMIEEIEKNIEE